MPRSLSLDTTTQRYLDHLETERGLSKNTLRAYGADLAALSAELRKRRPADLVGADVR